MDTLSISSLRARSLPRSLLRAPLPSLEFHTLPASPPHTTLPPPPQNTTTPSWSNTITCNLPPHDTTIGFVIRDTSYPHPPLAHLTISPRRALTQGWFPLLSHQNLPAGDLFVSLLCPTRCASKPIPESPDFPALPVTPDRQDEKRAVSPEPGTLFRAGTLRLAITADGVPATASPQIKITMADQLVIGGELQQSLQQHSSESTSQSSRLTPQPDKRKSSAAVIENVLRAKLPTSTKLEPIANPTVRHHAKTLLKGADTLRKRFTNQDSNHPLPQKHPKLPSPIEQHPSPDVQTTQQTELEQLQQLQIDEQQLDEASTESIEHVEAEPSRRFSFSKHGVKRSDQQNKGNTADVPERKRRRSVDFGSFELALFHGVTPKQISIQIQDSSSRLPESLTVLTDQTIHLPDLKSLRCTCDKRCNTHLLTFQMSDRGDENAKITLRITAESTTWAPIATDTIVTSRFRELMSTIEDMADTFKDKFPNAENLTYLLVGGLFTQHYPTYFEKNKQFLQEKLRLPRVQTIPIHTEGSIARNAKIIRDSILKTCRGSKSIVLIGHSKGGVDAVSILDSFPETIQFLYGIITFQAPFGGTFLVDFVARSRLAIKAISSVIEMLWKGDQDSLLDMAYSARAKSLQLSNHRSENTTEPIPNGFEANPERDARSRVTTASMQAMPLQSEQETDCKLDVFRQVPIVAFGSYASFDVLSIRSAANAAGVASMSPAAQMIVKHTGFLCDGLVTAGDARIPHADTVLLEDMMHTEPALYVQGTRYPPGQLTASALVLLFEKAGRNAQT